MANRKVLIVSPYFPPINAPDMQRTRMALPYFRALGWEPVVLACVPEMIEGAVFEPLLEKTYPSDIRVIRVRGIPYQATRWAGIGSLWIRCGASLRAAGDRLMREEKFDLAFFSTTQFDAFSLGPRWKRMFGVPFVLDYQDPWVNDYYSRTHTKPPGGKIKFFFSQWDARRREPGILREASGVISVSDAYGPSLARNYPWFNAADAKLLPFGAAGQDFEVARMHQPAEPLVPFGDGNFHHIYTGRCGPDMSSSLSILFRAFRMFLESNPAEGGRMRFHFIGTDYAPRPLGREWATPVAHAEGVEAFVSEHCYRVPYFDALHYLTRADALLMVGSNDPTYSASKLYPYVLARRPMLIIFDEQSPVTAIARRIGCGARFTFRGPSDIGPMAEAVCKEWFTGGALRAFAEPNVAAFHPYTAESMTQQLVQVFEQALTRHGGTK